MSKYKKAFYDSKDVLKKLFVISFIFLMIQISLTSILIFLKPKLYVDFDGFSIQENIFLYLGLVFIIFLVTTLTYILSTLKESK